MQGIELQVLKCIKRSITIYVLSDIPKIVNNSTPIAKLNKKLFVDLCSDDSIISAGKPVFFMVFLMIFESYNHL